MNGQVTCNQWAALVQVAEAHDIEWTYVEALGEPYRIDRGKRLVFLNGDTEYGPESYMAFAAALTKLMHENVDMLHRPARTLPPELRSARS